MYIQITDRCNMSCDHCCMACTGEGTFMSEEVFDKALELSGEYITIGGGEPTLHPQFWYFLITAIAHPWVEYVWMATNGSQTKMALRLAKLASKGVIGCELSQDEWHDPIDYEVIEAFITAPANADTDQRGIRDVTGMIKPGGRATKNELVCAGEEDGCGCSDKIIKPNGDIVFCACDNAPVIGTVFDYNPPNWAYDYDCFKDVSQEEMNEELHPAGLSQD